MGDTSGIFHILYILSYVRRGLCDPLFFFLRRALCAVQSSCTVLFRCARPTHALHASSDTYNGRIAEKTASARRTHRSSEMKLISIDIIVCVFIPFVDLIVSGSLHAVRFVGVDLLQTFSVQ